MRDSTYEHSAVGAVAEADSNGRPPRPRHNPVADWVEVADRLALQDSRPQPLVLGRRLLPLGYAAGSRVGAILKAAFHAQLEGDFRSVHEGIAWVQAHVPVGGSMQE